MPIFVHCPRCQHPTIVRVHEAGGTYLCRQCHAKYRVGDAGSGLLQKLPVPVGRPGRPDGSKAT